MDDLDPSAPAIERDHEPAPTLVDAEEATSAIKPALEDVGEVDEVSPAPGGPPTTAAGNVRKNEILDSAAELFADYGYHGASLRDISRRAGLSHPGMLHHFESKDALLDAVIARLEAHAQEALSRTDRLGADPQTLLNGLIGIWNPASHTMQLLAMLTTDAVSEDHPGRFRMSRLRRVHEHILETCFAHLAENAQLRAGVDPAFASRAFMDLVLGHAVREKTVRAMQGAVHQDSPVEDLARLLRVFLHTSRDEESDHIGRGRRDHGQSC